ncbi:MAG: hypothetical protein WKF88_05855 [Ferruginibacter sp.]
MEIKKLRGVKKLCIKYFNPPLYKKYKYLLNEFKERPRRAAVRLREATEKPEYIFRQKTPLIQHPSLEHPVRPVTSFMHSGNSGDIMYSLPAVFKLAGEGKVKLYLNIGRQVSYENYHPLGNVTLNLKMAEMLIPLLLHQPQIESCSIYNKEHMDYDLDLFRDYSFLIDRGSMSRWYFHVYAISAPLYKPWLKAPEIRGLEDAIVIARSHRYRNPFIDYSFLSKYSRLIFIGVKEEYDDMKKTLPLLEWRPVQDFLEMATIINSSRLFIGNQSFPFSIAESLKVNRLLEIYFRIPNVIPEGPGANDFMYQPQFEASVQRLYNSPFS